MQVNCRGVLMIVEVGAIVLELSGPLYIGKRLRPGFTTLLNFHKGTHNRVRARNGSGDSGLL